jgi:cytochrome b pre-mRNA-processing protein 3
MLWPFNHFWKPRMPPRGTIEGIYGMIVTQSREPLFYRDLGVPDTVNGRFDLLLLHLWLVLRRIRPLEGGAELAQVLFDRFCDDMDANLREMGVGDLTVPKRMQAFGEAFYGRMAAYDMALSEGEAALAQALCKNILNGEKIEQAHRLARYAAAAMAALAKVDDATLMGASFRFPSPVLEGAQP